MKAMLFNPFMSGVSAWMILVNGLQCPATR